MTKDPSKGLNLLCLDEAKEDVEDLLQLFLSKAELSFPSFCSAWKEMRFATIFGWRLTAYELVEFTDELLCIACEYMFRNKLYECVFGIYLCYALYSKQLHSWKYSKFRLTMDNFQTLTTRVEELQSNNYDDAILILLKLWEMGALVPVATAREAGLELGYTKYLKHLPQEEDENKKEFKFPLGEEFFSQFDYISKLYETKKKSLSETEPVDYVNCNFSEEVRNTLENFYLSKKETNEPEDLGSKRQRLKKKAFTDGCSKPEEPKEDPAKTTPRKSHKFKKLVTLGGKIRATKNESNRIYSLEDDSDESDEELEI